MNIRMIAPFAAASFLILAATAGANAFQCKGQAEAANGKAFAAQNLALNRSKANWTNAVKNKFGLQWSVVTIAAAPSQNCSKNGNQFQCTFSAKPCLFVEQ